MKSTEKIIVIGGGLSGLYLTYLLQQKGINYTVLEASSRLGGRIETIEGKLGTPMEIGATWFSDIHEHLLSLLNELGLEKYPQFTKGKSLFQTKSFEPPQEFYIPESQASSYRIRGGTGKLIEKLTEKIDKNQVILESKVIAVEEIGDKLHVKTSQNENYIADKVVVCIPPQLVNSKISFTPELPTYLTELLSTVQTWMAGSIKFTIEYATPFWREKEYSGMLFSHVGIVTEMHDHTNYEESKFGFTGFLHPAAVRYTSAERKQYVLQQLVELLGSGAGNPTAYFDKVWKNEFVFEDSQSMQQPHQNNGHPFLQQSQLNGKLFFCGTETSPKYGGYMEGALVAAKNVLGAIDEDFRK